jgi:hypothetical protein
VSFAAAYFHAQGQVVCPNCAGRIQSGQQAPPAVSLGQAALYGIGAAIAGAILYAAVGILLHLEIGIIAIVVGVMVGKAVRAGSNGLGGRPQQILAVLLTYFSITSSYIPVFFYQLAQHPEIREKAKKAAAEKKAADPPGPDGSQATRPKFGLVGAFATLILLFAAAPFLGLASGISGLISLFIIFIGLRQAWRLTGRSQILVMGPYERAPAQ